MTVVRSIFFSGTGAFLDDSAVPLGGGQLARVVLVVVDYLNRLQFGRSAAEFGHEPLVDRVEVALEEGVVAGRIVRELRVMAVAFAHKDVDLARLQDPIEARQLAEVDFERVRATLFPTAAAFARLLAALGPAAAARLFRRQNVLWLRPAFAGPLVMAVRMLFGRVAPRPVRRSAADQPELAAESPLVQQWAILSGAAEAERVNGRWIRLLEPIQIARETGRI